MAIYSSKDVEVLHSVTKVVFFSHLFTFFGEVRCSSFVLGAASGVLLDLTAREASTEVVSLWDTGNDSFRMDLDTI